MAMIVGGRLETERGLLFAFTDKILSLIAQSRDALILCPVMEGSVLAGDFE
jgi:hypothetical protein